MSIYHNALKVNKYIPETVPILYFPQKLNLGGQTIDQRFRNRLGYWRFHYMKL